MTDAATASTRSGFVALAGRPNAGKSTLANLVVGEKIAIVSDKPQTTRRAIRGVVNGPGWQLVLVDLPGVQQPRDGLTARMQGRVERELGDADAALVVLNAEQGIGGPGDRFIIESLVGATIPVTLAVNKCDTLDRAHTVQALTRATELAAPLGDAFEVFPISARTREGVDALLDHLVAQLPAGPFYFEEGQFSDLPESVRLAELVREQVLRRAFEEVPHAVAVQLEDIEYPREDMTVLRAAVWTETESQKAILIGAQGKMIKAIGTAARKELERTLGTKVHLELSVRVRRKWRGDDGLLDRLGIE